MLKIPAGLIFSVFRAKSWPRNKSELGGKLKVNTNSQVCNFSTLLPNHLVLFVPALKPLFIDLLSPLLGALIPYSIKFLQQVLRCLKMLKGARLIAIHSGVNSLDGCILTNIRVERWRAEPGYTALRWLIQFSTTPLRRQIRFSITFLRIWYHRRATHRGALWGVKHGGRRKASQCWRSDGIGGGCVAVREVHQR